MARTIGGPEDLMQVYGDPHSEVVTNVVVEMPDGDRGNYFAIGALAGDNLLKRHAGLEGHTVVYAETYVAPRAINGVLRFLGFAIPDHSQERYQADMHTNTVKQVS